jgi:RNA polymerase sigma-70 factor (ECF subfamily)
MTIYQGMVDMPERSWLDELYRRQRQPLFLIAWNVLRCPALAEDAVHSAFVRLAALPAAPREPKLYVFRAVRNAAIDLARDRGRRRDQPTDALERYAKVDAPAVDDESLVAAQAALEQLDEGSREVVELHLQASLTFQEIAGLLDQPLPTVASRYRRGLGKLRELLEICHE